MVWYQRQYCCVIIQLLTSYAILFYIIFKPYFPQTVELTVSITEVIMVRDVFTTIIYLIWQIKIRMSLNKKAHHISVSIPCSIVESSSPILYKYKAKEFNTCFKDTEISTYFVLWINAGMTSKVPLHLINISSFGSSEEGMLSFLISTWKIIYHVMCISKYRKIGRIIIQIERDTGSFTLLRSR